jgi:hypothetical protein
MTMRARSLRALAWGVVLAGAAACSASKVSLGDDGTGLRNVNPDDVMVASRACDAGAAHPNVCCAGSSCVTRDSAPFTPCAAGETAYPDGLRCCTLAAPHACTACDPATQDCGASNNTGFVPPPSTSVLGTACEHCPPGFTGTSPSIGGCCKNSGNSGFCEGAAGCAGVGCTATPLCAPTCASGFERTGSQEDVCCTVGAAGLSCYVWLPGDAGDLSCGGAASSCACRRKDGTHAFQMDCDDATSSCTCSIDDVRGSAVALSRAACTTQDTRAAAWVDVCHFTR